MYGYHKRGNLVRRFLDVLASLFATFRGDRYRDSERVSKRGFGNVVFEDAAFLLTIGSFLLTVELFTYS